MAAGCDDNTVKVWNVKTLDTDSVLPGMIYVVAFTRDSRHLLASTKKNEAFWCDLDTNARKPLPGYGGELRRVICVDLSPDRRVAALGFEDGMIHVLEVDNGKSLGLFQGHSGRVRTLSFSPDGNLLVSGGADFAVKVWDVKNQTKLGEKKEHKGAVCAAVMSHDGKLMASGCGVGTLKLWNPVNLTNSLITIPCHKSAMRTLDFSWDGQTLASGGEDKKVKLWNVASLVDLKSQREVASFPVTDKVRLVQFSPDNNILAIVTDDGVLRLLRAMTWEEAEAEPEAAKQ